MTKLYSVRLMTLFAALAICLTMIVPGIAYGATALNPFTQSEIDNNWEADRYFPTDGATSVTAFGRDDVVRIGIDSTDTQPGTFQRTEGIKTVGIQDLGNAAKVDLYLDPSWEDQAVRSGFWLSGVNADNERTPEFVIIEFVNLEPSDTGASAQGDHTGWRAWISGIGWFNLDTSYEYGEWYTLAMELDTDAQEYTYTINGEEVATQAASGETAYIGELFLNSYNYGLDTFPNLGNGDYSAHWHAGLPFERSAEITAPEAGEEVVGVVEFAASLVDEDEDDAVQWAVRAGTCAAGTNTVAGNVDGFSTPSNWDGSEFSSSVDMSALPVGDYCFIFNPKESSGDAPIRLTQEFVLTYPDPELKQACKKKGYEAYGFKNQGQCVRFIESGKDSR